MASVKLILANKSDKQALNDWEELLLSIQNATTVNPNETPAEKAARIKDLEKPGNELKWMAWYFPNFCSAPFARFQRRSILRFLKSDKIYHRRAWARGLAKSTIRMMELFYKMFVKKQRLNMLLISKNEGNAIRLLAPYRANLQTNQRLINDYGPQQGGKWTEDEFVTRGKSSFRAVGMGQNPRGARLDEMRVNTLVFDDADDDEVCRNPDRLDEWWKYVERAAIPTIDISSPYWICFDNNIIAEDSIAVRAGKYADFAELVNIRDEEGVSSWPEKNSEEHIDSILGKLSYESGQAEYFNNPMSNGKTFAEIHWGKCPPISQLPFVEIYADPATSNKDKPTLKSKANTSCKAVFVMGWNGKTLYIYKGFLDVMNNSDFIDKYYSCYNYATDKNAAIIYADIENNTLQNPFYEQVILPLIHAKKETFGFTLPITPDAREKPEKWFRIEGNLEPLNRMGNMIFNAAEKENPDMIRLEAQFKAAKATSRTLDGPDCIEGGYHKAKERFSVAGLTNGFKAYKKPPNKKRF